MSIVPFDFNGFELRTLGTWDAPLFVAADVCKILEIKNVSMACNRLKDIQKCISSTDTLGGNQDLLCVTATGLYALIMGSRKKVAVDFQEWVYEVIESIRKTGSYQIKPMSAGEMMVMQAQQFLALEQRQDSIEEENRLLREKLALIESAQEANELETDANTQELERFRNGHGFYFSIAGWCSKNNIKASLQEMNNLGRKAAALCRMKQITPQPVNDPRWGTVNTYPDSILMEVV